MPSPYEMTVDLNVLDHLVINLYSNIAAVLTEAVANAWDADATAVDIRVDAGHNLRDIQDDVIGKPIAEEAGNPNRLKASMDAVSPGSRFVHYDDTLISGAQEAYREYLERSKELDRLERIVD